MAGYLSSRTRVCWSAAVASRRRRTRQTPHHTPGITFAAPERITFAALSWITFAALSWITFAALSRDHICRSQLDHIARPATVGKTQVTLENYRAFVDATGYSAQGCGDLATRPLHPARCISWYSAKAYCEWVGGDLLTEAQWEYAARGPMTGPDDYAEFPWGTNTIDCQHANFKGCVGDSQPVGSYPLGASPFGALDMVGNVEEWCLDRYALDYYANSPIDDPAGPAEGSSHILRGGSFHTDATYNRVSKRRSGPPTGNDTRIGLRCSRHWTRADGNAEFSCDEAACTDRKSGLVWQKTPDADRFWGDAKMHCEGLDLGGNDTDWRLPTVSELRTLVRGCPGNEPGGACGVTDSCLSNETCRADCSGCNVGEGPSGGCYWPEGLEGTCGWYFTSSSTVDIGDRVWAFNFQNGTVDNGGKDYNHPFRCVRSGQQDSPDTFYDMVTGLIWQKDDPGGTFSLTIAMQYCDNLRLSGIEDWRLPTIAEIRSLIRGCEETIAGGACPVGDSCLTGSCETGDCVGCSQSQGPGQDGCYLPSELVDTACGGYWSSSVVEDDRSHSWLVGFDSAVINTWRSDTTSSQILCVRGP